MLSLSMSARLQRVNSSRDRRGREHDGRATGSGHLDYSRAAQHLGDALAWAAEWELVAEPTKRTPGGAERVRRGQGGDRQEGRRETPLELGAAQLAD
jgi:hypothetical protein